MIGRTAGHTSLDTTAILQFFISSIQNQRYPFRHIRTSDKPQLTLVPSRMELLLPLLSGSIKSSRNKTYLAFESFYGKWQKAKSTFCQRDCKTHCLRHSPIPSLEKDQLLIKITSTMSEPPMPSNKIVPKQLPNPPSNSPSPRLQSQPGPVHPPQANLHPAPTPSTTFNLRSRHAPPVPHRLTYLPPGRRQLIYPPPSRAATSRRAGHHRYSARASTADRRPDRHVTRQRSDLVHHSLHVGKPTFQFANLATVINIIAVASILRPQQLEHHLGANHVIDRHLPVAGDHS